MLAPSMGYPMVVQVWGVLINSVFAVPASVFFKRRQWLVQCTVRHCFAWRIHSCAQNVIPLSMIDGHRLLSVVLQSLSQKLVAMSSTEIKCKPTRLLTNWRAPAKRELATGQIKWCNTPLVWVYQHREWHVPIQPLSHVG